MRLLDDIHNYFPALLYNSGSFTSLSSVFHYVRHQMNTRFNLFSYGASRYAETTETVANDPIPTVILTPQMAPMAAPMVPPIAQQMRTRPAQGSDILTNLDTTLLLSLLELGSEPLNPRRGVRGGLGRLDMRDVIVHPTPAQIEAATEILVGSALTEETRCAICQDSIAAADTCRRLRHCNHTYHQVCIDQWFLRSVYCPTCRHDIREPH